MASDRAASRHLRQALVALTVLQLALPVSAAEAASPWWEPVALTGERVTAVLGSGSFIEVQTPHGVLESHDGGSTFQPESSQTALTAPPDVTSAGRVWSINAGGTVVTAAAAASAALHHVVIFVPDPRAPNLGAGAHLIAAPALYPGIVVAVAADGTVWRRAQDGGWARALLLLPTGLPGGVPRITGLAAFTEPLTGAVYVGTDGYAVLLSTDGGDDWIRAGPGLPDSVLALDADPVGKALWAGTSDGLWIHHLQSFPQPAVYHDAALLWRWVGIVLVSLAAAGIGAAALLLWPRPRTS